MRTYLYLLVAVITFSACSKPEPEQSQNILRMSAGPSPQSIDPHTVTGTAGIKILWALTENLLRMDYQTMTLQPAAAETWQVSGDRLKYTFKLRDDLKWSNGEPLTAHDFVFSWQRIFAPALGNQYATDFYAIRNAQALHAGSLKLIEELGVYAVGDQTLVFELHRIDPLLLSRLAVPQTAPVQKATIEQHGNFDDPANTWVNAGNFVGNGPFRLVEWELNKVMKVEKNPHYWASDRVRLDGIHFYPVETETVAERMFRTGQIDLEFGSRIPTEKIKSYKQQDPSPLVSQVDYASYFYLFNTTKPPFNDVNVRKAFTSAIDRELIVEGVTLNGESAALALSPKTSGYTPPSAMGFDPKAAKQYLSQAGYPEGKGFPEVTLLYNTMDIHRKIAVVIQQMWKQHLNVEVKLENQEWKVFLDTRQQLGFDIARAGSISSLVDPEDFLQSFTSGHAMNDTGWTSEAYDELIDQSKSATDVESRYQYLYQAESLLVNELPILPLFYYASTYLISPKVKGFTFNMAGQPYFQDVWLDLGGAK